MNDVKEDDRAPAWLPSTGVPIERGEKNWWVVTPKTSILQLGAVPDNARICLRLTSGVLPLTVAADKVRSKAKIKIVVNGGRSVDLKAAFKHVELQKISDDDRAVVVKLAADAKVRAWAGQWKLDQGVKGVSVAIDGRDTALLQLSGDAHLSSLHSRGPTRLLLPIENGAEITVDSGLLEAKTVLRDSVVTSLGDVTIDEGFGCTITAGGDFKARELQGSNVSAVGTIKLAQSSRDVVLSSESDSTCAILVGVQPTEYEIAADRLESTGLPANKLKGLTASDLFARNGGVAAADLTDIGSIAVGTRLLCKSLTLAEAEAEAEAEADVGDAFVQQSLNLRARDLAVRQLRVSSIDSTKGTLTASESLVVKGDCLGLALLSAEDVQIDGALKSNALDCSALSLGGDELVCEQIEIRGPATLPAPSDGVIVDWIPESHCTLKVVSGTMSLRARPLDNPEIEVLLADKSSLGTVEVRGRVRLKSEGEACSVVSLMALSDDSHVTCLSDLVLDRWTAVDGVEASLSLSSQTSSVITLTEELPSGMSIEGSDRCGLAISSKNGLLHRPRAKIKGDIDLILDGVFETVHFEPNLSPSRLSLHIEGVVHSASGRVELGVVSGRLSSDRKDPLVVLDLEAQADLTGQVFGVDPTSLPFGSLQNIESLYVFEPNSRKVLAFAKSGGNNFEIRERAQWMAAFDSRMVGRANSGRSRAAVKWASARLQHRSLSTSFERAGRAIHRMLGYSYKPQWPALLWVGMALTIPAFSSGRLGCVSSSSGCELEAGEYLEDFLLFLFYPFRVLRLTTEGATFSGLADWAEPVAGIAIGIPFLFTILALKNYLYSPADKD